MTNKKKPRTAGTVTASKTAFHSGNHTASAHLSDVLPPALAAHAVQATLKAIQMYGMDPATRAQAAAHEAGHVIMAVALGATVTSATVTRRKWGRFTAWGGETLHVMPGFEGKGPMIVTARDHPVLALHGALHSLAGFAGEMAAGLDHPASSMDERVLTQAVCSQLADVIDVPLDRLLLAVGRVCEGVIRNNLRGFNVVRKRLAQSPYITRPEVAAALFGVQTFDPAELIAALQKGGI